MTAKQSLKLQKLINKAMVAVLDAKTVMEKVQNPDESISQQDDRIFIVNKLSSAMDNLHWALSKSEL